MTGRVYFIGSTGLKAVKIGYTSGPPGIRLAALQTGCPARLELLADVPRTLEDERRLHVAFSPLLIRGEWFKLLAKLKDFAFYTGPNACRTVFHNALHDVLMQGQWHPEHTLSQDDYFASGDWEPFRSILWRHFGPWAE